MRDQLKREELLPRAGQHHLLLLLDISFQLDWMHPGKLEADIEKQEEVMLASSWKELFPFELISHVLAQPCCAQFALSRPGIVRDKSPVRPLPRLAFAHFFERLYLW